MRRTVQRLMAGALDRYDAVHAVAWYCGITSDITGQPQSVADIDPTQSYYAALEQMTAESWRQSS